MGRKGNWFSAVKKALSPESKEKNNKKSNKPNKNWFGKKQKQLITNTSSLENITVSPPTIPPHQHEEVILTNVEIEQNIPTYSVDAATAAAEVDMGSAYNPREISQLVTITSFAGKSRDEVAAIRIQKAFRGYLARRALRALKGLVRLKTLMDGPLVKRQSESTLRCMQTLSRVQSQIRSRRIRMSEENQALQKQRLQKHARELASLQIGEEWDDSLQSKEKIEASLLSKHDAAMKRERALAYAFSHQQTWKNSSKSVNPMFMDPTNPAWGWSWMERWTAVHPLDSSRSMIEKEVKNPSRNTAGGEISKAYARYQLNFDKHSPTACQQSIHLPNFKTPSTPSKPASSTAARKPNSASPMSSILGLDEDCKSMTSMQSRRHSISGSSVRDNESLSSAVPSYMVPTKSARAKSRLQNPLGTMYNLIPEKEFVGFAKKRLSFPPSPGRPRRHSGPPKVDISVKVENNASNGTHG